MDQKEYTQAMSEIFAEIAAEKKRLIGKAVALDSLVDILEHTAETYPDLSVKGLVDMIRKNTDFLEHEKEAVE